MLLPTNLMRPIWHIIEYSASKGCSVIRGHVYRGTEISRLNGTHIYGNYRSGKVHGFRIETGLNITSFGEDDQGEIDALSPNAAAFTT